MFPNLHTCYRPSCGDSPSLLSFKVKEEHSYLRPISHALLALNVHSQRLAHLYLFMVFPNFDLSFFLRYYETITFQRLTTSAYNFFSYKILSIFFSFSFSFQPLANNVKLSQYMSSCLIYSLNNFTTYCSQDIWLCPNSKRHLSLQTLLSEFYTQTSSYLTYHWNVFSCTRLDLSATMLTLLTKTCSRQSSLT